MPKVSVIIPIYNTEDYLEDCLQSVQDQSLSDFEVIMINDGSTDASSSIAKKWLTQDDRFKLFETENHGPAKARNLGLKKAQGQFITFVDSDDYILPTFLEKMVSTAENLMVDIVCCNVPQKQELNIISGIKALKQSLYQTKKPDYSAWNKLYRAELWNSQEFKDFLVGEDLATIPYVLAKVNTVALLKEQLYIYKKRNSSLLASPYTLQKAQLLNIAEQLCLDISEKYPSLKKAAESTLLSAAYSIWMRTADTAEFKELRQKAWKLISLYRMQSLLDGHTRMRNKIASLVSFFGKNFLSMIMKRGG
ncbi:MAG: glycosyltransferase family 2 protein [Fibrobacteraceae bacterium]|nr:glycosyltransferase family 2 protein [Fibrobacteraceae bacterium]